MRFYGHVMRCIGRRGVDDAKEVNFGGTYRYGRQNDKCSLGNV